MKYSLCFASFFWSDVREAIEKLSIDDWNKICEGVFYCEPKYVTVNDVTDEIERVNICSNLNRPVEVWIDPEGDFRILV